MVHGRTQTVEATLEQPTVKPGVQATVIQYASQSPRIVFQVWAHHARCQRVLSQEIMICIMILIK